jgi:hypothetical protein
MKNEKLKILNSSFLILNSSTPITSFYSVGFISINLLLIFVLNILH